MQEGGSPQRTRVSQGLLSFRRIKDELDAAILDGIDDMRAAFEHLIDGFALHPMFFQVTKCSDGRDNFETEIR